MAVAPVLVDYEAMRAEVSESRLTRLCDATGLPVAAPQDSVVRGRRRPSGSLRRWASSRGDRGRPEPGGRLLVGEHAGPLRRGARERGLKVAYVVPRFGSQIVGGAEFGA